LARSNAASSWVIEATRSAIAPMLSACLAKSTPTSF